MKNHKSLENPVLTRLTPIFPISTTRSDPSNTKLGRKSMSLSASYTSVDSEHQFHKSYPLHDYTHLHHHQSAMEEHHQHYHHHHHQQQQQHPHDCEDMSEQQPSPYLSPSPGYSPQMTLSPGSFHRLSPHGLESEESSRLLADSSLYSTSPGLPRSPFSTSGSDRGESPDLHEVRPSRFRSGLDHDI